MLLTLPATTHSPAFLHTEQISSWLLFILGHNQTPQNSLVYFSISSSLHFFHIYVLTNPSYYSPKLVSFCFLTLYLSHDVDDGCPKATRRLSSMAQHAPDPTPTPVILISVVTLTVLHWCLWFSLPGSLATQGTPFWQWVYLVHQLLVQTLYRICVQQILVEVKTEWKTVQYLCRDSIQSSLLVPFL